MGNARGEGGHSGSTATATATSIATTATATDGPKLRIRCVVSRPSPTKAQGTTLDHFTLVLAGAPAGLRDADEPHEQRSRP